MNRLWGYLFVIAFFTTCFDAFWYQDWMIFNQVFTNIMDMAKLAVDIAIGLIGLLVFWTGLMNIAEKTGVIRRLSLLLSPIFNVLMPEVPKGHPAISSVTMNMTANALGLDNAATPLGLKAMKDLQTLNETPDTASNAQILFLVINTSSVTLFPVTIFLYRAQLGAAQPADVFIPILLSTFSSTLFGLLAVCYVQKINLLNKVCLLWGAGIFALFGALIAWLIPKTPEQMNVFSTMTGSFTLLALVTAFIGIGLCQKQPVYEHFVSGAKQGLMTAIRIIPYLVAMLAVIGALRASGFFDLLIGMIKYAINGIGGDTRFVDALPVALMKPFSGGGSRALMIESMQTFGADSFVGRLSSMLQGSTETTFYVLAVYFGSVGIRKTRHAIACGLIADVAGITTAICLAYYFYG